jgi:hypothetical protein
MLFKERLFGVAPFFSPLLQSGSHNLLEQFANECAGLKGSEFKLELAESTVKDFKSGFNQ